MVCHGDIHCIGTSERESAGKRGRELREIIIKGDQAYGRQLEQLLDGSARERRLSRAPR